jgi:hypothetical protein
MDSKKYIGMDVQRKHFGWRPAFSSHLITRLPEKKSITSNGL